MKKIYEVKMHPLILHPGTARYGSSGEILKCITGSSGVAF